MTKNIQDGNFEAFEQYIHSFFDDYYAVIIEDKLIACFNLPKTNKIVLMTDELMYLPYKQYLHLLLEDRKKNWDNVLTHPSLFETCIHQYAHDMYNKKHPDYKHPIVKDIYTQFYEFFKQNDYVLFYFYDDNPFDWDKDIENTAFIEIKPHKDTLFDFTFVKPDWYDLPEHKDYPAVIYNPIIGYTPSIGEFVKSVCNTTYEQ